MKKHKPMSEEEYQSLLPSEKEIEKTMNELKESFSSHNPEAASLDPLNPPFCGTGHMFTYNCEIALVSGIPGDPDGCLPN